jgi:hypothetical protein
LAVKVCFSFAVVVGVLALIMLLSLRTVKPQPHGESI